MIVVRRPVSLLTLEGEFIRQVLEDLNTGAISHSNNRNPTENEVIDVVSEFHFYLSKMNNGNLNLMTNGFRKATTFVDGFCQLLMCVYLYVFNLDGDNFDGDWFGIFESEIYDE